MLLGGGVSSAWNDPRQDALYFEGYGPTELDQVALSYDQHERIVADIAAFGAQIFSMQGGAEEREWGLRMERGNCLPGELVEIAHRRYSQLPVRR
jgi:spectinomycin phosphotransferase